MSQTRVNVDGPSRRLLRQIDELRGVQPGPAALSRRQWGRRMAGLIERLAATGISQVAVPQWLPPTLARAVERERMRARTAA